MGYIDSFKKTWKTKKNKLLASACFNFAETLVAKSDLVAAITYFEKSSKFYKDAAKAADEDKSNKTKLLKFSEQTETRLEKIKELLNKKNNYNNVKNKPRIFLQKISDSPKLKYKIINKIYLHQATKESVEITNVTKKNISQKEGKRKLNEESFQFKATKQKKTLWTIEREKILEKFNTLEIDTDLDKIKFKIGSIAKRKTIAHNNYALFLIEDLNNIKKSYSHAQKITFLTKAIVLLTKSAEIYKNINFTEEKNNVEHCINAIRSSLKTLQEDKPILSARVVCNFFTKSFSEDSPENTSPQAIGNISLVQV